MLKLYCAATVYKELSLEGLKRFCPTAWDNFLSLIPGRREDKAKKLLREIGLLDGGGQLLPMEPDLLGEYFVLRQLEELDPEDSPVPGELVGNFHEAEVLFSFTKLLFDYPEKLQKQGWLIDVLLDTQFSEDEWEAEIPIAHVVTLTCMEEIQEAEKYECTVIRLRNIQKDHPDVPEVTAWYARALSSLYDMQTGDKCACTFCLLQDLHETYPNLPKVTGRYAQALSELSLTQTGEKCERTVGLLQNLHEAYPDSSEVMRWYALSLANLFRNQTGVICECTLSQLRNLCEDHPEVQDVTYVYAMLLSSLSESQTGDERKHTVYKLRDLHEYHL